MQYATDVKLFGRWSYEGVESKDISLMAYLNVKTIKAQVFLPFTAGRYQRRSFQKVNCPIVERLLNSLIANEATHEQILAMGQVSADAENNAIF